LKYLFPKTGDQIDENLTSFLTVLIHGSGAQTRHLSYRGHTFGHRSRDNILEEAHDCFFVSSSLESPWGCSCYPERRKAKRE
jgi:hypothetical protein